MALAEVTEEVADGGGIGREERAQLRKRGDELADEPERRIAVLLRHGNRAAAAIEVGPDPGADRTIRLDADVGERRGRQSDDQRALDDEETRPK